MKLVFLYNLDDKYAVKKNQFFSRLKSALWQHSYLSLRSLWKLWSIEDEYYHYCHFTIQHREAQGDKMAWWNWHMQWMAAPTHQLLIWFLSLIPTLWLGQCYAPYLTNTLKWEEQKNNMSVGLWCINELLNQFYTISKFLVMWWKPISLKMTEQNIK